MLLDCSCRYFKSQQPKYSSDTNYLQANYMVLGIKREENKRVYLLYSTKTVNDTLVCLTLTNSDTEGFFMAKYFQITNL